MEIREAGRLRSKRSQLKPRVILVQLSSCLSIHCSGPLAWPSTAALEVLLLVFHLRASWLLQEVSGALILWALSAWWPSGDLFPASLDSRRTAMCPQEKIHLRHLGKQVGAG